MIYRKKKLEAIFQFNGEKKKIAFSTLHYFYMECFFAKEVSTINVVKDF